jgi:hypothetical protein
LFGPALHGPRSLCQAKCRLGGDQASSGPIEKNDAQLRFKLRHMSTHGGLARLQLPGSGKQAAVFQYGKEGAYQRPVPKAIHK